MDKMTVLTEQKPGMLDVIKSRRSIRAFQSRDVSAEQIELLFEAARWAPSSVNEQPWRYIYATKGQPLWDTLFDVLYDTNKVWVAHAPLLIASFAKKTFSRNNQVNNFARYDLGAANAFMSLQAVKLGLQAHQLGGFDGQRLRTALQIPEDFELGAMLAIGYAGDPSQLPEPLAARETAPRQRHPLSEIVKGDAS